MSSTKKTIVINNIARRLADEKGGTIKAREEQVAEVFDALRLAMLDAELEEGDRVFISGFGIFKLKLRSGRTITNGLCGEYYNVLPKYTWTFKPAATFVTELNAD